MKYSIKINEVKSDDSQVKGFATITFGDELVVRNIAIVEKKDTGELFVSMPSHRTNDVTEKGEPIYRDICNPITKEFYEELTKNILTAFDQRKELSGRDISFGEDPEGLGVPFAVKVSPIEREDSSLKGIGRIYVNDVFVISNVRLIEGKNGMFISMPDYRTEKYKDGKPIYREIVFPITKEFRDKLYGEFEKSYAEERAKARKEDAMTQQVPEKTQDKPAKKAKSEDKEKEPAMAR